MGFEKVVCNFCGSDSHVTLFEIHESPDERQPPAFRGTDTIPVVQCKDCGLVFLNPRYDDERLTAWYQDPQVLVGTIDPEGRSRSIASERSQRVARSRVEVDALKQVRPGGKLLDVGCGLGFFLEALGSEYEAVGLEWSHPAVELARSLSLNVVEGRFPKHPFDPGAFDIVTFYNVFDHLQDPLRSLHASYDLLKPGGLLVLTMINFGGVASRVYGSGFRLLGPNHLYYFTVSSLRTYLDQAGFHLLKIEYPYFGTEFARPIEHVLKIVRDWWTLKVLRKKEKRLSPPFYGNMMRVFAVKLNGGRI